MQRRWNKPKPISVPAGRGDVDWPRTGLYNVAKAIKTAASARADGFKYSSHTVYRATARFLNILSLQALKRIIAAEAASESPKHFRPFRAWLKTCPNFAFAEARFLGIF
jgi:hypothetical protein